MLKKINEFLKKNYKIINIILALLVLSIWFYVFKLLTYTYIMAEFQDLRPVHKHLRIYYKGIVVGKAYKMRHSNSYTSTLVNFELYPSDLKLPSNVTIKLKKEKKKRREYDFFEIIYPEKPVSTILANGDILTGKTTIDVETYLANQDPDSLDNIKKNLDASAESLNNTISELGQVFLIIQDILEANQENLKTASSNFAQTTGNINQISSNLNHSLSPSRLDSTVANINQASMNVQTSTANLQTITKNLDGTTQSFNNTVPKIDSTLTQAQCIVENVNEITCGVKQTMRKRFGGMRLLFGRTIEPEKCSRRCCP